MRLESEFRGKSRLPKFRKFRHQIEPKKIKESDKQFIKKFAKLEGRNFRPRARLRPSPNPSLGRIAASGGFLSPGGEVGAVELQDKPCH
jgi:hypothetical protein